MVLVYTMINIPSILADESTDANPLDPPALRAPRVGGSHLLAGQLPGLLYPNGELSFVESSTVGYRSALLRSWRW
jgi:hypothetical protein